MDEFFNALYKYKYSEGDIIKRWKELENLFGYFSQPELTEDEEILACHLIFDASSHMADSRRYKFYDMRHAGEPHVLIENKCRDLIAKTKLDIKHSLYNMIEMHRSSDKLETQGLKKFISLRSSWDFYLVEREEQVPELRIFAKEFGKLEMRLELKSRFIKDRKTGKLNHNYVSSAVESERKRMRLSLDT
jgi:hypothetical protein